MTGVNDRHVMTARWRLEAPASAVWPLLADLPGWPRWWPHLRAPRRQPPAARSGRAEVAEFEQRGVWSWPPWTTGLRVTTTHVEPLRLMEWSAEADAGALASLAGAGCWLIEPAGGGTEVTLRWSRRVAAPRWSQIWLGLIVEWQHFRQMRAGAAGMAALLQCRAPAVSQWAAHRRG